MVRLVLIVFLLAVLIALSLGHHLDHISHPRHVTKRILPVQSHSRNNVFLRSMSPQVPYYRAIDEAAMGGKSACADPQACYGRGDCLDHGHYTENGKGYSCECHKGYFGERCQLIDGCTLPKNAGVCKNNGTCYPDYGDRRFYCACPPAYRGMNCEIRCDLDPCLANFTMMKLSTSFNPNNGDFDEIDNVTCNSLVTDLGKCFDSVKKDGEAACGCDAWSIEPAMLLKQDKDKFMKENCNSHRRQSHKCKNPAVEKCVFKIHEAESLVYMRRDSKEQGSKEQGSKEQGSKEQGSKEKLSPAEEKLVEEAATCLTELHNKGVTEAKGCPHNQWVLDNDPELWKGKLRLLLAGCPLFVVSQNCTENMTFCKDGDVDNSKIEEALTCIGSTGPKVHKECKEADKFFKPSDLQLKVMKKQCDTEAKVDKFKVDFGCPAPVVARAEKNEGYKPPKRTRIGASRRMRFGASRRMSFGAYRTFSERKQAKKATKYEGQNNLQHLVNLLKEALED